MNIYLIRHTTVSIKEGICYGKTDVPLSSSKEKELESVIKKLPKDLSNVTVYTSPLQRTRELAIKISKKIIEDTRLEELFFGEFENISWDDIPKEHPFFQDYIKNPPPKGENLLDLQKRVFSFWDELIINHQKNNQNIVIVSHAGPIRLLLSKILQFPLRECFSINIDFGGVTLIKLNLESSIKSVQYINR